MAFGKKNFEMPARWWPRLRPGTISQLLNKALLFVQECPALRGKLCNRSLIKESNARLKKNLLLFGKLH